MDDFRVGAIKNMVLGASLKSMSLKMSLAKEAAFIMRKSLSEVGFFFTKMALVHFLFVPVLRR